MLRKDRVNIEYTAPEESYDSSDAVVIPVDIRVTMDSLIDTVVHEFRDTGTSTDVMTNNEYIEGQSNGIE